MIKVRRGIVTTIAAALLGLLVTSALASVEESPPSDESAPRVDFEAPPPKIVMPPVAPPPVARGEYARRIVVDKAWRLMTVESNRRIRRIYSIGLGDDPIGHKEQRGDSRTPEGRYSITFKNDRSKFHLSLRISYPNDQDRMRARKRKVHPGSDIMIHGTPTGMEWWRTFYLDRDWTDGCIAVTNAEIEEIWKLVRVGTPIEIRR